MTAEQYSEDFWDDIFTEDIRGLTKIDLERDLERIFVTNHGNEILTPELATQIIAELRRQIRPNNVGRDKTYNERMEGVVNLLQDFINLARIDIPENIRFSIDQIINELNDPAHKSMMIITSDDPNYMRRHAKRVGNAIYRMRSRSAITSPLVSFVFDEADEFIPGSPKGTQEQSREIVETLARRGRKFGLGVGIATQRITYLDTNIMGQPHTYFISKLPRESDREKVAEAFGLSKEDMKQTMQFKKGQWLLISHDATGLDAVPIPIQTENSETKIRAFLNARVSPNPS